MPDELNRAAPAAQLDAEPQGAMDVKDMAQARRLITQYRADRARRAAQLDAELPPIDYDKDMDRTYIPLPGGWEIQTKGKGSTFRIAHEQQRTRWQVLDEKLHEPLEAMARDTRNLLSQYAERIRQLECEAAGREGAKQAETRMDAAFEGGPSGAAGTEKDAVIEAARQLVKAKGRYHTELNYKALAAALDEFGAHTKARKEPTP